MCIGTIEHPQHGKYYIFFSEGKYAVTKTAMIRGSSVHCAYATLSEALKVKGL
jgi:hypothetical protein